MILKERTEMRGLRERYTNENAWGLLTSIDIHGCEPARIRSRKTIIEYSARLCELINMKAYGDPLVVHFGEGSVAGFSMVQLIETSVISAHFANKSNRAFIDIFSCQYYDPEEAARFSMGFFNGTDYAINVLIRK
jgi:S-adenosylmethionine/arginine decarboxylase-like enzyme